jgi:hypothetical protein
MSTSATIGIENAALIPKTKQNITYRFAVFQTVLDYLPASQIREIADDYKDCIAWDLWAGIVNLDREIQNILIFCEFLDSKVVPVGISIAEWEFYRRTAERMVQAGLFPRNVLDQIKKFKSVRIALDAKETKSILSLAA